MGLSKLKITLEIDSAGVIYNPWNPPMLDAIIDYCLNILSRGKDNYLPERDDMPVEINLPLGKWHYKNLWGWVATPFLPDENEELIESLRYFRKKFRTNRISQTEGSPNLQSGTYREWNIPLVPLLIRKLTAFCLADRHTIDSLLRRNLRYIGQKRHRGFGRINKITVETTDKDPLIQSGYAMRWLPHKDGIREVRTRPPYWNINDRYLCCEIGEKIETENYNINY